MVTVYNSHADETVAEEDLTFLVEEILCAEDAVDAVVTVILCNRAYHQQLHSEYLGLDQPTDVLAFPLGDGGAIEGEVYVDLDTARERHTEFDSSFELEVARYVCHGTLHLLGFDDHDPANKSRMKLKENAYVEMFAARRSRGRAEP